MLMKYNLIFMSFIEVLKAKREVQKETVWYMS